MLEGQDRRLSQRDYLLRLARAMAAQLDADPLLNLVVAQAVELLAGNYGFIALCNPANDLEIRADTIRFTIPFNSLGWPALALPCGPAEDGLPASLQIAGRPGSDALVLGTGKRLESQLGS